MDKLCCVEVLSLSSQSLNDVLKRSFSCLTSKNDNVSQAKAPTFLVLVTLKNKKILLTFPEQLSISDAHALMGYPFRDPLECYSVCFDLILRK